MIKGLHLSSACLLDLTMAGRVVWRERTRGPGNAVSEQATF